jgi:putative membrane protein
VLLKLPTTELLKLGVISNRGFLVAAMIAGAVSQNTNLLKLLPGTDRLALTVEAGLREAVAAGTLQLGLWLLGMLLVAVVVVRLLSLVYWVGTQHGFTLTRDGDRLRVRRGLFTRVDVSGRVAAVQRLTLERSLMHRLFNRCTLRVDLPVSQIAVPGSAPRLDHLAPIATPAQARALIGECLPGLDLEALDWQPLHRSAAWRRAQGTLLRLLLPLSVAVGLAFVLPALPADAGRVSLAVAAALVGAGLWHAWRWAATAGFAVGAGVVVWRSGVFTRTWVVLPENQAQAVVLRRSPRDRRRGTARLCVDGQALTVTRALDIPWLAEADAARLRARLWHAAGQARTA